MYSYLKIILIFILFSVLTFYYTWPLLPNISTGFITTIGEGDSPIPLWNAYIFKHELLTYSNPFYTNEVFYPVKTNLWMHGYMPAMCLFTYTFNNLFLGINIYLMLHFIFSALGAYLLSYKLTNNTILSILVGIAFSFSAYKLLRLTEHYMLVLTATIPFYIMSFMNAFTFIKGKFFPIIQSKKYLLICLLLGIFTGLNDYYSTFYLIYFSISWLIYYKIIFYWAKWHIKKRIILLVLFFISMHLIIEPLIHYGFDDRGGVWWGGDLLAYFIPNANSFLSNRESFSSLFPTLFAHDPNIEFQQFLGYSMILILLYILYRLVKNNTPSTAGVWLFILLVCVLISLPAIKFNSFRIIYAPTAILHFLPFFNNIRCNTRIELLITLLLPLSFAILLVNSTFNKGINWIGIGLIIFMLIDLKANPYLILSSKDAPLIIQNIYSSNNKILTPIPTGISDGLTKDGNFETKQLFYQSIHQKKITGGYISRIPKETFRLYKSDTIMHTILKLSIDKNYIYPTFDTESVGNYFKIFQTDMFLIDPLYRNTNAEKFILTLVENKKIKKVEINGYLLISIINK